MSREVLVPVDDSGSAWKALGYALREHEGESITVLHVINPLDKRRRPGEPQTDLRKRAEEVVEDAHDRFRRVNPADTDFDVEIREGKPIPAILNYAEEASVDTIIMGTRGMSGTDQLLIGSVAEGVKERADVPVMVIE